MAASGYTPISLYYSTTAAATPTAGNLVNGELAINITDGKLYYKDNGGVVKLLASNATTTNVASISFGTTGLTPSTATTGVVTVAGTLVAANGGTGQSSYTAGDLLYASGTSALSKLGIGTNGYILQSNGSAPTWVAASTVVGGAAGSNTQIQYNNSGALGASSAFTYDGSKVATTQYFSATQGFVSGNAQFASADQIISGASSSSAAIGAAASNQIQFAIAGSEKMRLDSSGNLGLGVTPSAWGSGVKALQVGTQTFLGQVDTARSQFGSNYRFDGTSYYYLNSTYASAYQQYQGQHQFYTAASGTAGNAITFTQAMTLDASGRLGIGTTSPTTKLQVTGTVYSDNNGLNCFLLNSAGSYYGSIQNDAADKWSLGYAAASGSLGTPVLTWNSSGNVGIGTASPGTKLDVQGTGTLSSRVYNTGSTASDYAITQWKQGSSGTWQAFVGGNVNALKIGLSGVGDFAIFSAAGGFSVGTTADPGAGAIYATGNITAYYSSDRSLKENIKDVDGALEKVCAIGSKTFDWTDEYIASKGGEDGYFVQKSDFGVVAQDVQEVFPQAVRTRQDGTLAVDYEKLATLAFGAIKELVKRVEALEAK